ncbi:MAG TPA: late competence development ComFB family protein [Burkholderiaceae bacterium]|nr:late competence development ComFB family protein [Burkholderiaceae bacterium]
MQAPDFASIRNHHEQSVFDAVLAGRELYPAVGGSPDLLVDVACVALNRLPARYIRHAVDFLFYLTERERAEFDASVHEAVKSAFEFVQARTAMRARG